MKKIFSSRGNRHFSDITNHIVSLVRPEKIFLLSAVHRVEEPETIFAGFTEIQHSVAAIGIIVLSAETDCRPNDVLQDMIEHHAINTTAITALVFPVQQFNGWLMSNHPFATRVYEQAILLYDADKIPLAIPNETKKERVKDLQHNMLQEHVAQATEFLSGASLFTARKKYSLATFHLHQAAEQLYSGLFWHTTGLRMHTHNLDKLYRYAWHALPGSQTIFPRDTAVEKELFRCLQRAYTDGRYNSGFMVKYPIVSQLTERVQKLLDLCKTLLLPTSIFT